MPGTTNPRIGSRLPTGFTSLARKAPPPAHPHWRRVHQTEPCPGPFNKTATRRLGCDSEVDSGRRHVRRRKPQRHVTRRTKDHQTSFTPGVRIPPIHRHRQEVEFACDTAIRPMGILTLLLGTPLPDHLAQSARMLAVEGPKNGLRNTPLLGIPDQHSGPSHGLQRHPVPASHQDQRQHRQPAAKGSSHRVEASPSPPRGVNSATAHRQGNFIAATFRCAR